MPSIYEVIPLLAILNLWPHIGFFAGMGVILGISSILAGLTFLIDYRLNSRWPDVRCDDLKCFRFGVISGAALLVFGLYAFAAFVAWIIVHSICKGIARAVAGWY